MEAETDEEFLRAMKSPRPPITDEISDIGTRLGDTFIAEGSLTNPLDPTEGVASVPYTTGASTSPLPVSR